MVYPFGLYEGEPGPVEILERKAYRTINGVSHLSIIKVCPACNGTNAEWIRNEWSICFDCELVFTDDKYFEPVPHYLEYMEEE